MRHERVHINDKSEQLISYYLYQQGGDNRPELERMKRILYMAIRYELTDRQRDCLTQYYLDGIRMTEIARRMNLSKSTVSRHISAATRKLRKVAAYYQRGK